MLLLLKGLVSSKKTLVLTLVLLISTSYVFARQDSKSIFPSGSKVCFIGNSITNNGEYYNNLWIYYATRFPEKKIRFYNCGISGDVAAGILKRMDKDVLIHHPTHAVMMIGMNDVKRELYGRVNSNDSLKQLALANYRVNTERVVNILKKNTRSVILLKPSIYDQTAVIKTENMYGVNDALQRCSEHMQFLSKKYRTSLVDFQSAMLRINKQEQSKDPAFTIVGKDRVHPQSAGHLVMAYQFLKDTKAPQYVSRLIIGDNLKASQQLSFNSEIRKQSKGDSLLTFECLEKSLPFPVKESAVEALKLVPFNEDFNVELLQVKKILPGDYHLLIDDVFITAVTAEELSAGINLALYKNTPQYRQAIMVMNACVKYRDVEAVIRNLRFVEFMHLSELKESSDTTLISGYLTNRLEALKSGGHFEYHQKQFKNYLLKKGSEAQVLRQLSALADTIYQVNKPQVHVFKIVKQ